MNVGDICWGDLPTVNGHEQSGRRPVAVLQNDTYAGILPTVLIVPLTSSLRASRYPGTVFVPLTAANGLTADSILLAFQIRALDRIRFGAKIGVLEAAILTQLYQTLDQLTGHP